MISDASPKASPLLALTYGVRQLPGTADPLTYRFGPDVGVRKILGYLYGTIAGYGHLHLHLQIGFVSPQVIRRQ